jgi:hypothetical protein
MMNSHTHHSDATVAQTGQCPAHSHARASLPLRVACALGLPRPLVLDHLRQKTLGLSLVLVAESLLRKSILRTSKLKLVLATSGKCCFMQPPFMMS